MSFDLEQARKIADAVLYEGYILYPYRSTSAKNHVRFQFGVLAPRIWCDAGGCEHAWMRTECLVEPTGERPRVAGKLRALQLQQRRLETPAGEPVDSLEAGGRLFTGWDESVEREVEFSVSLADAEQVIPFAFEGGSELEIIEGAGRIVRQRWPVRGEIHVTAEALGSLVRLRVRVENASACAPGVPRDEALRASLLGAHTLLAAEDAAFVSLIDPPEFARAAASGCENVRTFPVLVGPAEARGVLLSSPIILYDHPEIAPESPADLYDGTEIDEILTLRTMTLTDQEKREARATDPRAAAIIDRVDHLPPEVMEKLHGAIRGRVATPAAAPGPAVPWWDPVADAAVSPETDSVDIGGVVVARGSRVRLRPRRNADAQDMFLEGKVGLVQAVFVDVEERRYVAVTVEGDPAAELQLLHGRYYYFYPEELEPS